MNALTSSSRLKLFSYSALFISIAFSIAGQLLMKQTMSNAANTSLTWGFLQQLIVALTIYSLGVLNWIIALRSIKLSVAYPLTSLNYVGILLGSYYFFGESILFIRILGVILIFAGVLLVAVPINQRKSSQGISK